MKFTLRGLFRVSQFALSNDLSMGGITINTFRAISSALLLVNLEITKKLEKKTMFKNCWYSFNLKGSYHLHCKWQENDFWKIFGNPPLKTMQVASKTKHSFYSFIKTGKERDSYKFLITSRQKKRRRGANGKLNGFFCNNCCCGRTTTRSWLDLKMGAAVVAKGSCYTFSHGAFFVVLKIWFIIMKRQF